MTLKLFLFNIKGNSCNMKKDDDVIFSYFDEIYFINRNILRQIYFPDEIVI